MTEFENLFYVERCRCDRCRREFAYVVFSGDTDMVTAGLASLTALTRDEVILARLLGLEYNLGEAGAALFADRIGRQLRRTDLVQITVKRWDSVTLQPKVAFFGFPKTETIGVYQCPRCGDGEARAFETLSPEQYETKGGLITVAEPVQERPSKPRPAPSTAPTSDDWTARETLFTPGRRYRVLEACPGWWGTTLIAGEVLAFERFAYSRYDGCHIYVFQADDGRKAWRLGDEDPVSEARRYFTTQD